MRKFDMLYIVNFDIKDSARVEQFARQLDEVGETLLFMPRCYFLKTNESVSGMNIYNKLKSVLKDEDLFVLAPVKVVDMNGWLATSAENGGYPPTQNGDIRSLFWLFSLMALQN